MTAPRPTILYAAGPGDVASSYRAWASGAPDPTSPALTYAGQFFDVCRDLNVRAYVVTGSPDRPHEFVIQDSNVVIRNQPAPWSRSTRGVLYHLGQIMAGLRLLMLAVRHRPALAVVAMGTHWFMLIPMAMCGVRVVPALHCAMWPAGHRPRAAGQRLVQRLNGWFWKRWAHATIAVSPECGRQVREIAPTVRGPIHQVRAQYRRHCFGAARRPSWEDRPFRMLYAGRIEARKGVFDLLDTVSGLEQLRPGGFTWEVCGDGPDLESLKAAAKRKNVANLIAFRGRLDPASLFEAYGRAHAVIIPTTPLFAEGLNKVAVEAVLAGRPAVTTRLSNAIDVLGDAAVCVSKPEPAEYVRAIGMLADSRDAYDAHCVACEAVQSAFYDRSQSWGAALATICGEVVIRAQRNAEAQ